jgi:hypothetical protein
VAAIKNTAALAGLVGGTLAAGSGAVQAVDLPEDRVETMVHVYDGGGTRAMGPAVLVRKSMLDRVSASATYYVDAVSNASIDVVTQASKFKETRNEFDLGLDVVNRDTLIHVGGARSKEPDYLADTVSVDLTQDVFGGMSTVALGFSRGADKVGEKGTPGWIDSARHWQYRLGLTQVLTPRWTASANLEAIADDGYLGSPYRLARVFGTWIHEKDPRTRSSRAFKLSTTGDITPEGAANRSSFRAEYRYFWDTWNIRAHTLELGYNRALAPGWLAESFVRYYRQNHALFYSDNASVETTYVTRNRQLSTFHDIGAGATVTYTLKNVPARYDVKLSGSYQVISFHYADYTDVRTGKPYSFRANVLQTVLSATF